MPTLAEQWMEEGAQQAMQENILDLLQIRFGAVPDNLKISIKEITGPDQLRQLVRRAATVETLDAFTRALDQFAQE